MDNLASPPRIKWAAIALLGASALGIAIGARVYYLNQRATMEAAAVQELSVVADAERKQIAAWRSERIGDGRVLMASPSIQVIERALAGPAISNQDRSALLALITALKRHFGYSNGFLVDPSGNIRLRLEEVTPAETRYSQSDLAMLCQAALRANDDVLSDIDQYGGQRTLMMSTIPAGGLGALVLEIDPTTFLFPLLASWPGPTRTGETMLVRLESGSVFYLNPRRYGPGLPSRRDVGFHLPSDAELDAGVPLRGRDYRGVSVVMEGRRVPNSPWYVAAKMDVAEFNAPLDRVGREAGLVLLALFLAAGAAAGWIRKGRQLQLQRQVEERFRAIADDTPAFLWMASLEQQDSFLNKTFAKFLGAEGQKLFNWMASVHPDDFGEVHGRFLEAMSQARALHAVFRMCRFDGEYRTCVSEALPRFSATGKFLGLCGSVADITDQAEAERKLITANTVLSKGLAEKTEREAEIRALSARLISAQEEERSRLSRELHDDLSQQIAALSIGMGNLKRKLPENQSESRKQSDHLQQKLVDLSEAVRRISHELHPAVLQHSGLTAALSAYCDEFEALMRIRVQLKTQGSFEELPSTLALTIYRIVQEALRNVARHARVDAAEIELVDSGEQLRLTIADRGAGIPAGKLSRPGGLGLVSIRERTRLVNGAMQIQTSPDQGTTLTIVLPKR